MRSLFEKGPSVIALAAAVLLLTPGASALAQSAADSGGGVQTTAKQSPADKQVAQHVYDKLTADGVDHYKHVTVLAENGVVTLGGHVDTTEALNKAKKIAAGIPGVTKVVDQMTLERAASSPPSG